MTKTKCPGPETPQAAARLILQALNAIWEEIHESREKHETTKNVEKVKPTKLPKRRGQRE